MIGIGCDETKMNQLQSDDRAQCWVRDGESQLQAHHVSQTFKHGGGAIFVWGLYDHLWHVQDRGVDGTSFVS